MSVSPEQVRHIARLGRIAMSDAEIEAWVSERMYNPHKETENVKKEMEAMTAEPQNSKVGSEPRSRL